MIRLGIALLIGFLLALAVMTTFGHVHTEHICEPPSMAADHIWHCWDEVK